MAQVPAIANVLAAAMAPMPTWTSLTPGQSFRQVPWIPSWKFPFESHTSSKFIHL